MSNRDVGFFIFDAYIAIIKIEKVASEFDTADELLHDFRSWDSVIREFEILGEASKHLLLENVLDPQYRKIVDFRNYINHAYFGIDENQVWNIVQNDLKTFKDIIKTLIEDMEQTAKKNLVESFTEDYKYLNFIIKILHKL